MESADGFRGGNYSFPVKFQMPNGLPGTFIHHGYGWANISYNMYVDIMQDKVNVGKAWSPIIVMQAGWIAP